MAIGGWRQGIPRPRGRRRPPPPPPPPASHPALTGFTPEEAAKLDKKNESMGDNIRATAVLLKDPSAANAITSSMDAQAAARKASGQTATVK